MMPNQVGIACIEWMMSIRDIIELHHIASINQSMLLVCVTVAFSYNERKGHTLKCPVYKLIIYQFFHEI